MKIEEKTPAAKQKHSLKKWYQFGAVDSSSAPCDTASKPGQAGCQEGGGGDNRDKNQRNLFTIRQPPNLA